MTDTARVLRLSQEIDRHRNAMRRRARDLDAMATAPGECCPSCKYGAAYVVPSERQRLCGENLARLLRKRGGDGDADFARTIENGHWP